jgi:hypothetical protein
MPGDADKNLDLVNRFIGWGDPRNSLWFVGLEEGEKFDREYLEILKVRQQSFHSAYGTTGELYWQTADMMASEAKAKPENRRPIRKLGRAEARIRWELDREPVSNDRLDEYAADQLWRAHTFHCNLYTLGYQRRKEFPSEYAELFGLKCSSDQKLKEAQAERHRWLRELVGQCLPAAILCLGLQSEEQFASLLGLLTKDEKPEPRLLGWGRRISIYRSKTARAIVMTHLSWASRQTQRDVIAILRDEWAVSL